MKVDDRVVAPLWAAYRNGCSEKQKVEIRNRLAVHYMSVVKGVAYTLAERLPPSVDPEDLVSIGFFGLLQAIESFDATKGFRFATFARFRIRGFILDELRTQDFVPRLVRIRNRKREKAEQDFLAENGRPPTPRELCSILGLNRSEYENFIRDADAPPSLMSLNQPAKTIASAKQEIEGLTIEALVEDTRATCVDKKAERDDFITYLLSLLSETERVVLLLYYFEHMTFRQIAHEAGLTESRIVQVHTAALRRLQRKVQSEYQEE